MKQPLFSKNNEKLISRYKITSWFYDIIDYPWEREYRKWRPNILKDVSGDVLEAGVGTGRNLKYYKTDVNLTGIDLSPGMLRFAKRRAKKAECHTNLFHMDALHLNEFEDNSFDYYISTFMYCVMPDELQFKALSEMTRVLKPGGKFKIIEIIYSKNPKISLRQNMLSPFVEKVYGARFDRKTCDIIQKLNTLELSRKSFLKDDTYLFLEGKKK